MAYPYALLRTGFRYQTALGGFTNTSFPHDLAFGEEGRIYVLCTGNSGPISIVNLDDEDLGSFGAPGFGFRASQPQVQPWEPGLARAGRRVSLALPNRRRPPMS